MMSNIAIIPIRAGSKGLKNKNMLFFNKKPLVCQTIKAVIDSKIVSKRELYVSTDSKMYIDVLKKFYPDIQYHLRPKDLAADDSSTGDFLKFFLNNFSSDTNFILCQATSPLRDSNQIRDAFEIFKKNKFESSVVSVTKASKPKKLYTRMNTENHLIDIEGIDKDYKRQNEEPYYIPNGAIYISRVDTYLNNVSFFLKDTTGYLMDKQSSIDIDNKSDFQLAEMLIQESSTDDKIEMIRNKLIFGNVTGCSNSRKVFINDGRMSFLNDKYSKMGYRSSSLFYKIKINEIVSLLSDDFFKNCTELIISAGLFSSNKLENDLKLELNRLLRLCVDKHVDVKFYEIPPILYRIEYYNDRIVKLNKLISKLCDSYGFEFIELNRKFFNNNGELNIKYTNDGINVIEVENE